MGIHFDLDVANNQLSILLPKEEFMKMFKEGEYVIDEGKYTTDFIPMHVNISALVEDVD